MEDGPDGQRGELLRQGALDDGVELVEYESRFRGVPTRQQQRTRRKALFWWWFAAVTGVLAIAHFVAWPWRDFVPVGAPDHTLYRAYTPLLGFLFGLSLFGVSAGLINHVKLILPQELSIQERHPTGPSGKEQREIFRATMRDTVTNVGLTRRSAFGKAIGAGAGVAGLGLTVLWIGGFVKNPWVPGPRGEADTLWHTGWYSPDGEKVYLRKETVDPHAVELVRPGDIAPGGLLTVYPFRESERGNPEKLRKVLGQSDNPATLFRFLPDKHVMPRPDRAGMNYGDYYAFSRVCTHLGCAPNLYEKQLNRVMCPCHQSQFDLNDYAQVIFGPAARPLPQLPIALDDAGFFYATGDFTGPVGPAFWELPT